MGEKGGFNRKLNDTRRRFTYFAPRDKAWVDANITYPSTIKVLFMDEYAYHVGSCYYLMCHMLFSKFITGKKHSGKSCSNSGNWIYNGKYSTIKCNE